MKNRKGLYVLISGCTILFLAAAAFFFFFYDNATPASEDEIREVVQRQYQDSTITSVEDKGSVYEVMMEHKMGEYQLVIDRQSREITSLKLLSRSEASERDEGNEPNEGTDPTDEEAPADEEQPTAPPPSMLTREQAVEIALKEVPGKVDDVELDEKNGIKVYEVEIEVDDDSEATIIINAYTGEVISLTWD